MLNASIHPLARNGKFHETEHQSKNIGAFRGQ